MSEPASEQMIIYGNPEINSRAADWVIAKREGQDWSPSQQAKLDAWLAEASANMIAYLRIDQAWARAGRLNALRPPRPRPSGGRLSAVGRLTAAVAALALVGVIVVPPLRTKDEVRAYATGIGGRATISLGDGSKIDLNTDTKIRISDARAERKLWLDKGEAYFDVVHDAAHPLVLATGNYRIIDLGTKFFVRVDGSSTRVSVQEGSVAFVPKTSDRKLTLRAGDALVATGKDFSVVRKSPVDLAEQLGWRTGVVIFKHTSLADAAAELNRYDEQKLVVADELARMKTVSGTFPAHNPALFARLVRVGLGLHIDQSSRSIVISSQ